MKIFVSLPIFASLVMVVLIFKTAHTDAAALADENDASSQDKKGTGTISEEHIISSPHRRQYLKFGVLGKRYSYGYLGKRNEVPEINNNFEEWLNEMRERRAGRPQYGLLG